MILIYYYYILIRWMIYISLLLDIVIYKYIGLLYDRYITRYYKSIYIN